jgi:hypothetical protein
MTYRGKIKNGVVVLDKRAHLPEGTTVTVRPLKGRTVAEKKSKRQPTLYERLKPFIGVADDLPPDASINVDHYLYGAP